MLQEADLLASQIVQLSGYAIFCIDLEGNIQTWNAGVERLFGYGSQEWIGQPASIVFTPSDQAVALCRSELNTAREGGQASDIRWHRRKDGTNFFANGVLESVCNDSGKVIGFIKVVSDETERKRLQDSLVQSNMALEHFAYAASHDLQEPLRTVRTFAELLSRDSRSQLTPEAGHYLGFIVQAISRMSSLITDLLTYAKAGVEKRSSVSIPLDNEVEAATTQLKAAIDETHARVTHDPLPVVTVEHAQITRLFLNLISNAIKYRSPDEPPHVHISVADVANGWATISVQDNGRGFPSQYAEMIFEPFTRLEQDKHPGSGVGLTICRRIVERSGGKIWAESEPGKGARFLFTLPLQSPDY